ncbi:hypothetical protein ACEWY4_009274 [Coilia grayii]|uniref:Uncharacterized protein n=1 Tax=Coilia grayii TaxID=363190 RepID=A0ABD1K5Y6_9TELE
MSTILRLKSFSKLDYEQKLLIIKQGRPTPPLPGLHQRKGQKIIRTFLPEWYTRKEWLCGCDSSNRLFCFPCLLFSQQWNNVWVSSGYTDLNNLPGALAKHERSGTHIQHQIALKTFGKCSPLNTASDQANRLLVSAHNAKVRENREILNDLICATCYLAKQEIPFVGNNESAGSSNRGNYMELLNIFAEKDDRLSTHLKSSSLFTSNQIQNDLILAIGDVLRQDIKAEVNAAPFVSVQVDETTDIMSKPQLSVTLRYVSQNKVKEAFWGFSEIIKQSRAAAVTDHVLSVLDSHSCTGKLVAQTYDGAVVMASELSYVQEKIKEKAPGALLVHCYAHDLDRVLSQSAKSITECRVFFQTAEGLASFFNKSVKRTKLLIDIAKGLLGSASTWWSSHSMLVKGINAYYGDLLDMFRLLSENEADGDSDTHMMAVGYAGWLSKDLTCFILMVFGEVFKATDGLSAVLQSNSMDIAFCCEQINDTMTILCQLREDFDSFYNGFEESCQLLGLISSFTKSEQPIRDQRRMLYHNILDNISTQIKARFDQYDKLSFVDLVDPQKFKDMSDCLDELWQRLVEACSSPFNFSRLRADLIGLHSSPTIQQMCTTPAQLLDFLHSNDLTVTVPEAWKLLSYVLTLPTTMASGESSFSALNRIETYSQNKTGEEPLSSLALISIESERLTRLKEDREKFYSDVIERFVEKDDQYHDNFCWK